HPVEGGDRAAADQTHLIQLATGEIGDRTGSSGGVLGGGAVDGLVMDHRQLVIGAEMDIAFEDVGTVCDSAMERGEGVLRFDQRCDAVPDDLRVHEPRTSSRSSRLSSRFACMVSASSSSIGLTSALSPYTVLKRVLISLMFSLSQLVRSAVFACSSWARATPAFGFSSTRSVTMSVSRGALTIETSP